MDNLEFFLTVVYQVDLSFPWVKMSGICTDQVISCIWTIWYVVDVKHLAVSVTLPDPPASETCYKPLCKVKFTANKNWFTTREVPPSTCNAIVYVSLLSLKTGYITCYSYIGFSVTWARPTVDRNHWILWRPEAINIYASRQFTKSNNLDKTFTTWFDQCNYAYVFDTPRSIPY